MTQFSTVARRGFGPSMMGLSTDSNSMTPQVWHQLTQSTPVASASLQWAALSRTTGSAARIQFLWLSETKETSETKWTRQTRSTDAAIWGASLREAE